MKEIVKSTLPTKYGCFEVKAYPNDHDEQFPDLALYTKGFKDQNPVNVRIHSECMTGDVFGSSKCDCGEQLDYSMRLIQEQGGVLLYLRQEGRGIGLINKLKAYNLQETGMSTIEANIALGFHADLRDYNAAIDILKNLGINRMNLLTNNPLKLDAFIESGIEVVDRVAIETPPNEENKSYLKTKKDEMGHFLTHDYE